MQTRHSPLYSIKSDRPLPRVYTQLSHRRNGDSQRPASVITTQGFSTPSRTDAR